jgi:hypothetical protein
VLAGNPPAETSRFDVGGPAVLESVSVTPAALAVRTEDKPIVSDAHKKSASLATRFLVLSNETLAGLKTANLLPFSMVILLSDRGSGHAQCCLY